MTPGEINRELDRLDKERTKLSDEMIAAGRGDETAEETARLDDPLARRWNRVADRQRDLHAEIVRRAGPGNYRMPTGRMFGPRRRA